MPLSSADLDRLEARGLLALAAYCLRRQGSLELVPAGDRDRVLASLELGRAGALRWEAAIEQIVAALAPLGIEPVLLKGADLGFHCYPQPGLRAMTDLDLLVPRERLEEVSRALSPLGFRERAHDYSREWYLRCRAGLPPLVHELMGVHVDVHGSLLPPYSPFGVATAEAWTIRRPSRFDGAHRLPVELLVWHLAVHAVVIHLGTADARERAAVDLLFVLAGGEVDGVRLRERARSTGTGFAVARALGWVAGRVATPLVPVERRLERGARRAWHALRHAAPFVGDGQPNPPDAWRQFGRRALRLARGLVAGGGE